MSFETFFASDKFNLFQTIIPYVGSKNGLFIYRVLVMIVLIFGYYCSIYTTAVNHNPERDWMWFSYFTNQNYVAITIYFLFSMVSYFRDVKGTLKGKISISFLHTIVHIFYNILFPLAFIVTTVFWSLIFPFLDRSYFTFNHWAANIIQHFFQFVFLGIDWFFITIPTNYHHFIPMFVVGVAYLIFAQIYHLIYDIWIYGFLDPSFTKYWYLLYIGLVIVWTILGFVFAGIQNFKNRNRKFISGNDNNENNDIELA